MTGEPASRYVVLLSDPLGNRQAVPLDYSRLAVAWAANSVSALTLTLPGGYDRSLFGADWLLEVWRTAPGGGSSLLFDKVWFIRRPRLQVKATVVSWSLTAYCPNFIFGAPGSDAGRSVAYNPVTAYTNKLDSADDVMKAIVRENAGSLATDTARDLSAYLTVQADLGAGASVRKEFARRNVLRVLQELAQASTTAGTYCAFDTICTTPPSQGSFALEFRTYTGQRGNDHRASSGMPVLLGPDFGNLDDVELDEESTDEANYIYAGGQRVAGVQAIAPASDADRIALSPFNRRELFVEAGDTFDATALADEADSALRANRVRRVLTGTFLDTDQARFGVEWGAGDYLTAQVAGFSFDCRADGINIDFDRDGGETIRPTLRGEL